MRHTLDGYYFLVDKGFEHAVRIFIIHSFPLKHINSVAGKWDCLIEKRSMGVALRHGVNEFSVPRLKHFLEIQKEFEGAIGPSVYKVLDRVVGNTFGLSLFVMDE